MLKNFTTLLGRDASRDLFDSHQLLTQWPLNNEQLRLAFTVYAGMERDNWQRISLDNIKVDVEDMRNKLFPVLQFDQIPKETNYKGIEAWVNGLATETKNALSKVLPFNKTVILNNSPASTNF